MLEMESTTNNTNAPYVPSSEVTGLLDLSRIPQNEFYSTPAQLSSSDLDSVMFHEMRLELANARMGLAAERVAQRSTISQLKSQIDILQVEISLKNRVIEQMRQMVSSILLTKSLGMRAAPMVRLATVIGIGNGITEKLVEVFIKAAPEVFPKFVEPYPQGTQSSSDTPQIMTDRISHSGR